MKIAFISYEYPPDTAYGGIATYVYQAAQMLSKRGHQVEVFTSSPYRSGTQCEDGLLVHRVKEPEQMDFSRLIGQLFARRHAEIGFDVLEGPEFFADAREAVQLVPDIPFVLKLHTPSIFLLKLNFYERSFVKKMRLYARGLLAGMKPIWGYDPHIEEHRLNILQRNKIERLHALEADEIAAPSKALGNKLIEAWGLDSSRVFHVPYPYIPSNKLLKIPVETYTNVVTFLGRLEMRKGVLDLAKAIPTILRSHPDIKIRFVGETEPSPDPNLDMQQYLERKLWRYRQSLDFVGPVPFDKVPNILTTTDICVFPSIWENFPCVCLEAMAAARGIVGSAAGGMADMLNSGQVGRLVPPHSPRKIAEAVIELLDNPGLRIELGQAARDRLLTEYSSERVSILQEESYVRAIARRRAAGVRFSETNCWVQKQRNYQNERIGYHPGA